MAACDKRLKQNLKASPELAEGFTDFVGDNENAIRIQIRPKAGCALIAGLLITIKRKVFKFKVQPAYSTITGLVHMHLMRYVDLHELLLCPNDPTLFGQPPTTQIALFNASPLASQTINALPGLQRSPKVEPAFRIYPGRQ